MQIGIVGLGRMGANIARRLMRHGHECVVFDANLDASLALGREGATSSAALQDLVKRLKAPRVVWLMVPAGEATAKAVDELAGLMAAGDTIIDGGNTFWKDDIARAAALKRARHPLSRCRHQRRRVGARTRLLPDDRRREGGGRAARSDLPRARAGRGRDRADAASRGARSAARAGLSPCRAERRRAFRQDDPQRHRIRADAGLRRGLRYPAARGR